MSAASTLLESLPPSVAGLAASLGGVRLRRRRYGGDHEARVARVLERERWSAGDWETWRGRRLAAILELAAREVPWYRQQGGAEQLPADDLAAWPVLSKETLRREPERLLRDGVRRRRLIELHTSGSTGTPLRLWRDPEAERAWYAVYEARTRRWFGVSWRDRWAIFGGRRIAPAGRDRPPYWIHNRPLRQLYCSSYHIAPGTAAAYAEALTAFAPRFVVGYPSTLGSLAEIALERDIELPRPRVVIANGEPLATRRRRAIETAFGAPVSNTWGMTEIVAAASECERGTLHLWPEVGVVEPLDPDEDRPLSPGRLGRLVCTGLLERSMPLVRYDVGDLGRLGDSDTLCACGRSLPVVEEIVGRTDDVVVTPDGRRIGRLDPLFKGDYPIREAQVVQEAPDRLRLRVVPARDYTPDAGRALAEELAAYVGDLEIELEEVDAIERGPAGKFPAVVSRLA